MENHQQSSSKMIVEFTVFSHLVFLLLDMSREALKKEHHS